VTIYRRIERYGLERKRFAKSELARTVSGT
jgi:hypothetical protein